MSEVDITLLGKELIEDINKNKTKRINSFEDVFSKVKKGNREGTDVLKTIEKTYVEEQKAEKEILKALENEVNVIDTELKTGLDAYYANYSLEAEQKKLQESKEKGLQPKILVYRKETHDNSFKLDRILKEEKDTLKAKQDEYESFDKSQKAKILDLEKKNRYEINKEKTNTLNTYDELQKSLLNTNNRHEIKDINKQIYEIRKVGIKNEKNIRLEFLGLIKDEKIAYELGKAKFEKELKEIEKEYAIKKLELDTEKKHINLRYQIEIDKYDFGSRRALNNLNQKMLAKKNSLILASKEKKMNASLEYQKTIREKIEYKKTVTGDFGVALTSNYQGIIDTIASSSMYLPTMYLNELDKVTTYISILLTSCYKVILVLHQEYVENIINNEYENMTLFINAKNNYEALCKYNHDDFLKKYEALFEDFKNKINENYDKHEAELVELLEETKALINKVVNKMKDNLKDDYGLNDYHERLKELLEDNLVNINEFSCAEYEKEYNSFELVDNNIKEYNDAQDEAKKENDEATSVHDKNEAVLDDEIKAYNDVKEQEANKINEEAKAVQDEIEAKCSAEISEFDRIANENINAINLDKEKQIKEIDADYQTQMSLLR